MSLTVLHVFCQSEIGGAEAVILNFIRFRLDDGIRHKAALITDAPEPLSRTLDEMGVPWEWIPRGRMRQVTALAKVCRRLRRLARQMEVEVVLANMAQPYLYARCAFVGTALPVVLYQMMVPAERIWHHHSLDILVRLFKPRLTFAASQTIADRLTAGGFREVERVYHGTPTPVAMDPDRATMRAILERAGIGPQDPVVLMPGRLQRWKGQHLLIEAFPEVLRAQPNAHAVILGSAMFGMEEDYQAALTARIAALGLEQRVHLIGYQKVPAWLERAAIVVHASTGADAFPNVCIEAMSAGRPLITNTASGTAEILTHGTDALVIKPNDATELGAAINLLLGQPLLAKTMGEAGRRAYERHCTPDKMVRLMEAGLRRIAGGGC